MIKYKIVILGNGLVGNTIIKDLVKDKEFQIFVSDIDEKSLIKLKNEIPEINIKYSDLQNSIEIEEVIKDSDLVISAVPGFMGFNTLKTIINKGKNVVDISFFEEPYFLLKESALEKDVTAVIDCGVAPGLCNIILGYTSKKLQINKYICYVGGLPVIRNLPYEYKTLYSPKDVLEMYTRPVHLIENNTLLIKPALSDLELIDFPVGTLEAFNTDGLRSLLSTMDNIPNMIEKTLRWPGHAKLMGLFRDSGFFNKEFMEGMISPLDMTTNLFRKQWDLDSPDFTIMRIIIEGKNKNGNKIKYTYDLMDSSDEFYNISSMARTTGYTCTAIARQIASGFLKEKGIILPENLGKLDNCYRRLFNEYDKKGINITLKIEEIT